MNTISNAVTSMKYPLFSSLSWLLSSSFINCCCFSGEREALLSLITDSKDEFAVADAFIPRGSSDSASLVRSLKAN